MKPSPKTKYVYLTGPDGSGKSTYLHEVREYYNLKNKTIINFWLRSPKILSKPLMGLCRLIGLTQYQMINGITYGKHDFHRSKFVSLIFPLLQYLDFRIKWSLISGNLNQHEIILFDRFALDTLADLMVDTSRYDLHKKRIGKAFLKLIPTDTLIIALDVKPSTIKARKLDTLHDPHLDKKVDVYSILTRDLTIPVIDNNRSEAEVWGDIKRLITKYEGN